MSYLSICCQTVVDVLVLHAVAIELITYWVLYNLGLEPKLVEANKNLSYLKKKKKKYVGIMKFEP